MAELLILGAGPSGLMTALEAARNGHRCTVLEAAEHVGGMAGSFKVAGHRVDYGSHRLHPATSPQHMALIQELLGDDLQLRTRRGRINLGGRWVGFPLRATDLIRSLPPSMTGRLVGDSVRGMIGGRGPTTGDRDPPTFYDEVIERFGPTVADEFYGPYAIKLYGTDPRDLSAELAHRRIAASSPADIARRLAKAARPTGRTFYYPKRGYGQIAERLADAAVDAGVAIELATAATSVRVDDQGAAVDVTSRADGSSGSYRGDLVLSTIPVTTLADITTPAPPPEVSQALGALKTRAMILVYLVLDRPQFTPFDAHYIPGLDTTVARLSEPKNYRDGDDPSETTVLCAEIACWQTDDIWSWPDDRLADLVAEDLARVGLPPVNHSACATRRLPSVYPVYDLATAEARRTAEQWTGSNDRLLTLGRQGLRAIDNLHHVMAMGQGAVHAIGDGGVIDATKWQEQLGRFADHTVED